MKNLIYINACPYIKALSYLWGWGELTVISAQNMDYSTPEEIEETDSPVFVPVSEINLRMIMGLIARNQYND